VPPEIRSILIFTSVRLIKLAKWFICSSCLTVWPLVEQGNNCALNQMSFDSLIKFNW
jgi:hypothetical protein